MNVITAKRDSACAACAKLIVKGEQIVYERERGALHLACAEEYAGKRRNEHPSKCTTCGVRLGVGEGELSCSEERQTDGKYRREWITYCVDKAACVRHRLEGGEQVYTKRDKARLRRRMG